MIIYRRGRERLGARRSAKRPQVFIPLFKAE